MRWDAWRCAQARQKNESDSGGTPLGGEKRNQLAARDGDPWGWGTRVPPGRRDVGTPRTQQPHAAGRVPPGFGCAVGGERRRRRGACGPPVYASSKSFVDTSVDGGAQAPPEAFGLPAHLKLNLAQLAASRRPLHGAAFAFQYKLWRSDFALAPWRSGNVERLGGGRGRIWSEGIF